MTRRSAWGQFWHTVRLGMRMPLPLHPPLRAASLNPFWRIRLAAKNAMCAIGQGSRLIEYCEDCGIRTPLVWWSPDEIWTELTGYEPEHGDNMPGVLCPRCFDNRASRRGIVLQWHPKIAHRLPESQV